MDRLSALFMRFTPNVRVFQSGPLCQVTTYDATEGVGHLHLLRSGSLRVYHGGEPPLLLNQPSLVFCPQPRAHRLHPEGPQAPELLCASLRLGSGAHNPLVRALPTMIVLPLSELDRLGAALDLLFAEGLSDLCGRQVALDRLMEYVLILLLRHLLDRGDQTQGLLAALANPRLARALNAMHAQPRQRWTLETLASQAGMSRARFAHVFHQTTGVTPLAYLTEWRLGLAQALLMQSKAIGTVADAVGYGSAAAFSRVFAQHLGLPPRLWLAQQR